MAVIHKGLTTRPSPDIVPIRNIYAICRRKLVSALDLRAIIVPSQIRNSRRSKMAKTTSGTRVRSAVTGEYVKKSEATKHPRTTVTERVNPPKKK